MKFTLVKNNDGEANITVLHDGELYVASSDSHQNFKAIVAAALNGDEGVIDLFDHTKAVSVKFHRLSERVTINDEGTVYFDGVEVNNALTATVNRYVEEGNGDEKPLIAFLEKVQTNDQLETRDQLFNFLKAGEFSIAEDGDFIAYKGVNKDADGTLKSTRSGPAIVDGTPVNGYVPQPIGAVIEMARNLVQHDPRVACASGLHVGTYSYAKGFAGTVLKVKVNPRDVVSVPNDYSYHKVRTCRYTVVDVVDGIVPTVYDDGLVLGGELDDSVFDDVYDSPVTVTTNTRLGKGIPSGYVHDYRHNKRDSSGRFVRK